MSASIDFTPELSDLVSFMSRVAIEIRMYTPYSRTSQRNLKENIKHVLWLSDSIHSFEDLAGTIKRGDIEGLISAVDRHIAGYQLYMTVGSKWVSDPMLTFKEEPSEPVFGERYDRWVLDDGIALFKRIKEKAEQAKNLTGEK